jgi:hypothetical protein
LFGADQREANLILPENRIPQNPFALGEEKINFKLGKLMFVLFLGLLPFGDKLADLARVISIECFHHGFRNGIASRKADDIPNHAPDCRMIQCPPIEKISKEAAIMLCNRRGIALGAYKTERTNQRNAVSFLGCSTDVRGTDDAVGSRFSSLVNGNLRFSFMVQALPAPRSFSIEPTGTHQ